MEKRQGVRGFFEEVEDTFRDLGQLFGAGAEGLGRGRRIAERVAKAAKDERLEAEGPPAPRAIRPPPLLDCFAATIPAGSAVMQLKCVACGKVYRLPVRDAHEPHAVKDVSRLADHARSCGLRPGQPRTTGT